ncbi:PKD domain-containing protein [Luteolibacter marinus]|uniref:PKD domain-containing protein n=1 Tax=Luteolibacter marinus TaxID=2776705 RepID=UPI0018667061|nr:hypothetical protein [Luteolibacter marinus]
MSFHFTSPWKVVVALLSTHLAGHSATVPPGSVYQETSGIVVMEAERTPSSLGSGSDRWEVYQPGDTNYVHGATREAHLEFLGNSSNGGSPEAPLTYTFKIHDAGYYHLHLRCRARLDGAAGDKNNDCYVRMAGLNGASFGPGPDAGNSHMDDAPLSMLSQDTKMYGGSPNSWGWANLLDAGGSSNKRWPVYRFDAGSTYRLTISGRSIKFNLDRIVLRKSTVTDTSAKAASIPESALEASSVRVPEVARIMVIEAGTDTEAGELTDGATINLATGGPHLNLRVDTSPPIVGSVQFELDGDPAYRTDGAAPYSIGGDNIWDDYLPWSPSPGNHVLTVTPRAADGTAGTPVTVNFSVIDQLPAGSPVADAGGDRAITLPVDSIALPGSASDADGSVSSYWWDQVAGPSIATWSGRTGTNPTVSDLTFGVYRFRLTVTDNSGLKGFDEVEVTLNLAPGSLAVDAGPDRTVVAPATSVTLNGSADDPGNVSDFELWTQLSGPSNATRTGETTLNLTLSDLVEGTYVFRLRLFDGSDMVGADDVAITVTGAGSAGNPVASAGPDRVITLPQSSVVLSGSGSDPDGSIASHAWTQVSGPAAAILSGAGTSTLTASGLVQGSYGFRLTVTDNNGLTGSDEVQVTVQASGGSGQAVTTLTLVNADTDQDIGPIHDGDTIDLAVMGAALNIRADTSPATVGSVRFAFDGDDNYMTQSGAPYTIGGDALNDYYSWTPPLGAHVLTATPFTASSGGGTAGTPMTVSFTVIDSGTSDGISGFPPPTIGWLPGDQVQLRFQGLAGRSYAFQRSATLTGWTTLQTLAAGDDGKVEFIDPDPPEGRAYYRLATP